MNRVKVTLPLQFNFQCEIPVRITDLNYGGHVGNDTILTIIHEARQQYFVNAGYTELDLGGVGTIMSDVAIEFKTESFYGDTLIVSVAIGSFSKVGFDLFYKLEKKQDKKRVAHAKTGMVCFDYSRKKIVAVPEVVKKRLL